MHSAWLAHPEILQVFDALSVCDFCSEELAQGFQVELVPEPASEPERKRNRKKVLIHDPKTRFHSERAELGLSLVHALQCLIKQNHNVLQ
jgi:hypothetical protein